jgi:phosphoglycolate phosphatase
MRSVKVKEWPRAVLFDLDGTLVDSAPDIAASANALLARYGHASLQVGEVRSMIGNGVGKLVERAFAARGVMLAGDGLAAVVEQMMEIYSGHLTNETVPMPGASEAMRLCRTLGAGTGVVTNKPEAFSRTIIEAFGWSGDTDVVVGGDTGPARKPAPDMLLFALRQLDAAIGSSVMVGDSPADIDAARAAGMRSIAVRGGYTNIAVEQLGADIVIDTLVDLGPAIRTLTART